MNILQTLRNSQSWGYYLCESGSLPLHFCLILYLKFGAQQHLKLTMSSYSGGQNDCQRRFSLHTVIIVKISTVLILFLYGSLFAITCLAKKRNFIMQRLRKNRRWKRGIQKLYKNELLNVCVVRSESMESIQYLYVSYMYTNANFKLSFGCLCKTVLSIF